MGATLAHLYVLNFNLTKKQTVVSHSSIDFAVTDPARKAQRLASFPILMKECKWDLGDTVVQIITIPLVAEPQGWVLHPRTEEPELGPEAKMEHVFNTTDYSVLVECRKNDLSGIDIPSFYVKDKKTGTLVEYSLDSFTEADGIKKEETEEEPIPTV